MNTWKVGDTVGFSGEYSDTKRQPIFPGLFFYSGFGHGHYYGTDGKVIWTTADRVYKLAQADGLNEYTSMDCMAPHSGYKVAVPPAPEPVFEYCI